MPVITYWPENVHDVDGITGDPRIFILDGLTPFGVSVCFSLRVSSVLCRFAPGHFILLSSVRPSSVPYGE